MKVLIGYGIVLLEECVFADMYDVLYVLQNYTYKSKKQMMQIVFLPDAKNVDIFHNFVDFFITILCVEKDNLLINC